MVDPVDACLSPNFGVSNEDANRPHVQLVNKTNSSLTIAWNVPQLQKHCHESLFGHPPMSYVLNLTLGGYLLPGYPLVCAKVMIMFSCKNDTESAFLMSSLKLVPHPGGSICLLVPTGVNSHNR